jgi:hypothetical protein
MEAEKIPFGNPYDPQHVSLHFQKTVLTLVVEVGTGT